SRSSNGLTVPCIWKLVSTDSSSGCAGERCGDDQVECCNRITTAGRDQIGSVCSRGSNGLTIPGVWQLISTNSCICCAGYSSRNDEVECCNRIAATNRGQIRGISSGGGNCLAVPG